MPTTMPPTHWILWPDSWKDGMMARFKYEFPLACQNCMSLWLDNARLPVCTPEHEPLTAQQNVSQDNGTRAHGVPLSITSDRPHHITCCHHSSPQITSPQALDASSIASILGGGSDQHMGQATMMTTTQHTQYTEPVTQVNDHELSRQTSRNSGERSSEQIYACLHCDSLFSAHRNLTKHMRDYCYCNVVWYCTTCGNCARKYKMAKLHQRDSPRCPEPIYIQMPSERKAFGCRYCSCEGGPLRSVKELSKHLETCAARQGSGKGFLSLEMHGLLRQEGIKEIADQYIHRKPGANGINSLWWEDAETAWLKDQIGRLEFGISEDPPGKHNCGVRRGEVEQVIKTIVVKASVRANSTQQLSFPGTPVSLLGGMTLQSQRFAPTSNTSTHNSFQAENQGQGGVYSTSQSKGKGKHRAMIPEPLGNNEQPDSFASSSSYPTAEIPSSLDLNKEFYEESSKDLFYFDSPGWSACFPENDSAPPNTPEFP